MFGYLRPYKPELKIRDYADYNAVYCGLCRTLGRRYGFGARLILSYDATLMCILGMALENGCCGFEKHRCSVKPLKKCNFTRKNPIMDYWADVSVILSYYKIKDNLRDEGFTNKVKGLAVLPFVSACFKKAASYSQFAARCAKEYITAQSKIEQENCLSLDEAANPTAVLMSELLSHGAHDTAQKRILERIGIFVGRWIYFADAADDIEQDIKKSSYNPFALHAPDKDRAEWLKEYAAPLFNSCIYEITAALNLLELKQYKDIIYNTFFLGLPEVKKSVLSGLNMKEKKKRFSAVYRI